MIRVTSCIILAATLAVAGAMDTEQPMRWDGIKDASNFHAQIYIQTQEK